jgi:phosphatidate cytidylyltransferase
MGELPKRVAVAFVGIPTVLGIVYVGGWLLAGVLAVFAVLGSLEVERLAEVKGIRPLGHLAAIGSGGLVLLAAWRPSFRDFAPWALGLFGALTVTALVAAVFRRGYDERPIGAVAVTLLGPMYVGLLSVVPLLHALPGARGWTADVDDPWSGFMIIALPLAATWVGDASAYFAGSAWGRSRLAPRVSPNKSWVGFWADLAGSGAAAALWYVIVQPRLPGLPFGLPVAIALGGLLGLGAVVGDLFESLLKREAGVKDSGAFFPGHGGVMDRLDSLILTAPLTYVAIALLGAGP